MIAEASYCSFWSLERVETCIPSDSSFSEIKASQDFLPEPPFRRLFLQGSTLFHPPFCLFPGSEAFEFLEPVEGEFHQGWTSRSAALLVAYQHKALSA